MITAKEAAEKVAPFLGLSLENDQSKLFLYLDLAQKRAWKSGKFKGFIKEFDVATYEHEGHRYIKTPHGYNVCMGLNLKTKPVILRESYFQFHHNGPGSLTDKHMLQFVNYGMSYHEHPTLIGPQLHHKGKPFEIMVLARQAEKEKYAYVYGTSIDGQPITTYDANKDVEVVAENRLKIKLIKDQAVRVQGLMMQDIMHLSKDLTLGAVEFYGVYEGSNVPFLLAVIGPHQTFSQYRIYELPHACQCKPGESVHGLFSISEPETIVSPHQPLVIDDLEAIISLCLSADISFDKKEIEKGEAFGILGIRSLAQEKESGSSPTLQPIQIIGMDWEGLPDDHYY